MLDIDSVVFGGWIDTKRTTKNSTMTSINPNAKKKKVKPPKSRPEATFTISQPLNAQIGSLAALSAFSDDGKQFALLSLAVDKHRLRVYDTGNGKAFAEYTLQTSRASCLAWVDVNYAPDAAQSAKKRKRRQEETVSSSQPPQIVSCIALGLANGSVAFFSPSHGSCILIISHPVSNTPILDVAVDLPENRLWTSSEDASIRLWDLTTSKVIQTWQSDAGTAYTRISLEQKQMDESNRPVGLLAAHHSIHLLSLDPHSQSSKTKKYASFTGHASSIHKLQWIGSRKAFITAAERDSTIQGWEVPKNGGDGSVMFSTSLDADVKKIHISSAGDLLVATSASGTVSIAQIPTSRPSQRTVELASVITMVVSHGKGNTQPAEVIDAMFGTSGHVMVVRLVGGARPVFETVVSHGLYRLIHVLTHVSRTPTTMEPSSHKLKSSGKTRV